MDITIIILTLITLLLTGSLVYIIWRLNYGYSRDKRLQNGVREAEKALHKAFDMLREDVSEQVMMLEKAETLQQLTEEEGKIVGELKKNLTLAESFVAKEIEDIEKEVQ